MKELRGIAATLIEGHRCDTLLDIAKTKLANRDSLVMEKVVEINKLNEIILLNNKILTIKNDEIKELNLHLKKEKRKLKWTKMAWGTTSVALGAGLIYFAVR
jgi:hypothetical protein